MTTQADRQRKLQKSGDQPVTQPLPRELGPGGGGGSTVIITSVTVTVGEVEGEMMVRELTYQDDPPRVGRLDVGEQFQAYPMEGLSYDNYLWMAFDFVDEETTPPGIKAYTARLVGDRVIPVLKAASGINFVDDSLAAGGGSSV